MKDKILKIVKSASRRVELLNIVSWELTVNYKKLSGYPSKVLDKNTYSEIESLLDGIDITVYNITFELDTKPELTDYGYPEGWEHVYMTFYSGSSDEEDMNTIDLNKFGRYNFRSIGSRGELNIDDHNRIINKKKKRWESKNSYSYDKVDEVIDLMIKLDLMLDYQYNERRGLLDNFKQIK